MRNVLSILFFLCFQASVIYAQSEERSENIKIQSDLLGQERLLKVYLPDNYSADNYYPVFYITDGSSSNFDVAKSYLDILSNPTYDVIPPSILVGIPHKERDKDLNIFEQESGIKFKRYLFEEAIPYIDSLYSTSGFNSIIGHSNGAEYNHFLLLDDNNPFRGFICISTNFNTDVKDRLASFLVNYKGERIYYFVANGTLDAPSRTQAGNDLEELYKKTTNSRFEFIKKTYKANHLNLVPISLIDGFRFIFQYYNNIEKYPSIRDYADQYLIDLKNNYGIEGNYKTDVVQGTYLMDIMMNKKLEEYEYFVEFANEHGLSFNGYIDHVNRANQYFFMGAYDKTIEYINKAAEGIDSVENKFFYNFLPKAIQAYAKQGRLDEVVDFMEKGREALPEEYRLFMNYRLARFSLTNNLSIDKGKEALEYCKANYRENKLFTLEDLAVLEKK
jgi:predicted alpha/beta superfamily hydrolase